MWKSFIKATTLVTFFILAGCQTVPDKKTAEQSVVPAGAKQTYAQAINAVKAGRDNEALRLFTGLTRAYPDFAAGYTSTGLIYLKQEKLVAAEQAFNQAITLNPADAVAYNHLGVVLRQRGQFEEARQAYENALRINAAYATAHLNLGILNDLYLQNLATALQHYQHYQALTGDTDQQVAKWIVDLERRVSSTTSTGGKQG